MVIHSLNPETEKKAQALARELNINLVAEEPNDYFLCYQEGCLVVRDPRQGPHFSICLDFDKELELLKRQRLSLKKDLLCRAVGFKGQDTYKVFDGTMGMAKDSIQLLYFGCQVVASEADPVAFALVRDAFLRMEQKDKPFQMLWGDTCETIKSYDQPVDCLYLDPMFEDLKKKSAPKKAMALLRTRNITSKGVEEVIEVALAKGIKRIVVKRPIKGKQLYTEPTMNIAGKLVRYDVYIR